jgi:hypothetical protein
MKKTAVPMIAAAVLLFAACGGSDGETREQRDDTAVVSGDDNSTSGDDAATSGDGNDEPVVAGLCTVEEPDCDDTGFIDAGDVDGGDATLSGGMTVGGGLTVDEALTTDATGILAVHGNLFDDGSGLRLCSALAESLPPQCGGPASLAVVGFGFDQLADEDTGVQSSGGVSWTDGHVTLFGEVVDGTLLLDPLVAG